MKRVAAVLAIALSAASVPPLSAAPLLPVSAAPAPVTPKRSAGVGSLETRKRRLAPVSVTLPLRSCAGSIVGSSTQVLTAAHCVPEGAETLAVIHRGRRFEAVVALIDRRRDTALLALDEELDVEPLELEAALPRAGEAVFFLGRIDRPLQPQLARVVRLGRCPSLPGIADAIITDLQARPGDSGAPILNDAGRVVGVIHGGAACHVAAPTAALARILARPGLSLESPEFSGGGEVARTEYRLGPFVLEKRTHANGASYRFAFRLGAGGRSE